MLRRAAAFLIVGLAISVPAAAADGHDTSTPTSTPIANAIATAAKQSAAAAPRWTIDRPERRPSALLALYGTYAVAQTLDLVSTRRAIAAGASEMNPAMGGGNMKTMIAVKAAAGVSTIFFAERAWKKNRVGAILLMAALDGATSAIAAHNMQVARR